MHLRLHSSHRSLQFSHIFVLFCSFSSCCVYVGAPGFDDFLRSHLFHLSHAKHKFPVCIDCGILSVTVCVCVRFKKYELCLLLIGLSFECKLFTSTKYSPSNDDTEIDEQQQTQMHSKRASISVRFDENLFIRRICTQFF